MLTQIQQFAEEQGPQGSPWRYFDSDKRVVKESGDDEMLNAQFKSIRSHTPWHTSDPQRN